MMTEMLVILAIIALGAALMGILADLDGGVYRRLEKFVAVLTGTRSRGDD